MGCADSSPNVGQAQTVIPESAVGREDAGHANRGQNGKVNSRESKNISGHVERPEKQSTKKGGQQSEQIKGVVVTSQFIEQKLIKVDAKLNQSESRSGNMPEAGAKQRGGSKYTKSQLHNPSASESNILQVLKADQQTMGALLRGEELLKNKQFEAALKQYKKIKTEHFYLWSVIGYCEYQQSSYDKAIEDYGRSLRMNDKHAPTWFRLGRAYYYKEEYGKAIQQFSACLALDANNAEIGYQIGLCYYYLENYGKAIEVLLKSLEVDSQNTEVMFTLARCYFYQQNYKKAIQWCTKIVKIQPSNADALSYIGYCHYQMSQYEKAIEQYELSIKIKDNQPLTHYRMGLAYYWQEKYDKSIEFYQKAINLNSKNDLYYVGIGNSQRYNENYESAIEWYRKALAINSKNNEAHWRMGICYYYGQDYKKAVECYKKAIKIDENYANPYVSIGDCSFQEEDYENAVKYYLYGLAKKYKPLNYCNFMIAKCYYFNEQGQKAVPYFQKAIEQYPTHIVYHVYYGRCLLEIQNFAQSFKIFTKAKQLYDSATDVDQYSERDYLKSEIDEFIKSAAEWQEKRKIGYISAEDKLQIKKMRGNFEKKYKAIFGVECADEKESKAKPVDQLFLQVVNLIHQDEFVLDLTKKNESVIVKIASLVRNMFNYDDGAFQIFAYLFQEFMWMRKFKEKMEIERIEKMLDQVLSLLSENYPSTAKTSASTDKPVELPVYKEIKCNLFTEVAFFESYDIVVLEIEKINQRAMNDLQPFKEFVYTIEKNFKGNHAKVGMKLPSKPEKGSDGEKEEYQQKLFKVLIRILQKMFKELGSEKEGMLKRIDGLVPAGKKIPLYAINQIIMSTWIQQINSILGSRKANGKATECFISDLVRGKCMFQSVADIKEAVSGVVKLCEAKGYQIMELDNRLMKVTQDVVFKIKIKEVVSEFQMALQFDLVSFDFGHNFYQIQRCPLGCIFGSSLFLTKDVSESFLQKVSNSIKGVKAMKAGDKQTLKSLKFVLDSFKASCKTRHHIF